nr:hypothetical protein [Cryobacterium sp. Y50]
MKPIYTAPNPNVAKAVLDGFEATAKHSDIFNGNLKEKIRNYPGEL